MEKKIIVAPLNWGLGHAARCVPIINALLENNFTPIIASDGNAFSFLQKEFPNLHTLELPSYHIKYGKNIPLNLFLQIPKIWKAVRKEQKVIQEYIENNQDVIGIISDNRFGVRNSKVPSIYITHQINVLSGVTTFFTSKIHQKIISYFDECWIPDTEDSAFSGKLSSIKKEGNFKFIGVLSRFKKEVIPTTTDILLLLSGPEPNRTFLENRLENIFLNSDKKIILVRGKVENQQTKTTINNLTIYNFLLSNQLQTTIQQAKIVVCRSGYSSIMDLAVLEKKAFFIPTKNQSEQEYLANYLAKKNGTLFCEEEKISLEKILKNKYHTLLKTRKTVLKPELFSLFKRK